MEKHPPLVAGLMARTKFLPTHPSALAIYCADGRFTESVEDLLRQLGHERLDTLTLPGGPALLNLWSASFSERETVLRATKFLIEGHVLTAAILVAHAGCGFYKRLLPHDPPELVKQRQLDDLRRAAQTVREAHPEVSVGAFYASPVGERVAFEKI